ncbi:MAG: hypothetical protein Q7R93_03630 [bacterium]|nr:hypothetical protein [bacterium]
MPWHQNDPKVLSDLLPEFFGGEFIIKEGIGEATLVFRGKIDRVVADDSSMRNIVISSQLVYEKILGGDWKQVDLSFVKMPFAYTWYYRQPRHARLKLEFEPNEKEKSQKTLNRCWLCSHTHPIYLDLFRTMLMNMFLKECVEKESKLRKWLNRFKK